MVFQEQLAALNPSWKELMEEMTRTGTEPRTNPDGDVGFGDLQRANYTLTLTPRLTSGASTLATLCSPCAKRAWRKAYTMMWYVSPCLLHFCPNISSASPAQTRRNLFWGVDQSGSETAIVRVIPSVLENADGLPPSLLTWLSFH